MVIQIVPEFPKENPPAIPHTDIAQLAQEHNYEQPIEAKPKGKPGRPRHIN